MKQRTLVGWLKDAHVMETRSLPILRRRVGDEPLGLDARARLESHLRETEQHAERVRQALRALGSAPPPVLRSSEPIVMLTQDFTSRVFSDWLVISAIADLAAEQFEVAAYTTLIAKGGSVVKQWPGYCRSMAVELNEAIAKAVSTNPVQLDLSMVPETMNSGCAFQ